MIRTATAGDAHALVVLRAAMFEAMGDDVGPDDAPWRRAAEDWFADSLGEHVLAVVAEVPGEGVVASAMAVLVPRAPSPGDSARFAAHVSQVSTLPAHRRRGHARACLVRLLEELGRLGVRRADLRATAAGEGLYRGLGFRETPYPALRRVG